MAYDKIKFYKAKAVPCWSKEARDEAISAIVDQKVAELYGCLIVIIMLFIAILLSCIFLMYLPFMI